MSWKKLEAAHAEALRRRINERQSLGQISRSLGIGKGTLSLWLREYPLSEEEQREKCGFRILVAQKANCKACGIEFERTNSRKQCCSETCKSKYNRRERVNGSKAVINWRRRIKIRAVEYKGGKCQVCGYCKCIRAMKFHHIDPSKKDFSISSTVRSWESIKAELDKCILVCGNCHDEIHDGLVVEHGISAASA